MGVEAHNSVVAKFGGTSMAQPEVVLRQLEQDDASVVVVSAAGLDETHKTKTTDMLLAFKNGRATADDLQHRFKTILQRTAMEADPDSQAIVGRIPHDLQSWVGRGNPVEALGEYWSAQLFARQSGGQFVDARDLIFFDNQGNLNRDNTDAVIRSSLLSGNRFVIPGFYGARADGSIQVFERGGSDITGAIIASALGAREYHNWSDVPGFMTADPRKVADAQLLPRITYREARELGSGGSELLHRTVIKLLGGTGTKTIMRQTFGELGNRGTTVVDARAWVFQPIVAVTGRADLLELSLHEYGLNEGVGSTVDLYQELKAAEVPWEHTATSTDDVSVYVSQRYRDAVEAIVQKLRLSGRGLRVSRAGLVQVVGEGVAQSGTGRLRALGQVSTALAEHGVEGMGGTDVGRSATLNQFFKPEEVETVIAIIHHALKLAKTQK